MPPIPVLPVLQGELNVARFEMQNNILRLYFRQLNSALAAIKVDTAGGGVTGATAYTVTGNHTTSGSEILNVTAAATITLNTAPRDRETVAVAVQTTGTVNITGDFLLTTGDTTVSVTIPNTTITIMYVSAFSKWVFI